MENMRAPIRMVTYILLAHIPITLDAQRLPKGEALTIEDGLGFRDVSSIVQDNQGLMWFGTRQGLSRYDGYRFTRFGNDRQADQYFPGETIQPEAMQFINDSILHIVSDNRLYSIRRHDFQYHDLSKELAIHGDVLQLRVTRDNYFWFVLDDAVQQYLFRGREGEPLKEIAHLPRFRRGFTSLAIDTAGNAWWSTVSGGLKQFSEEGALLDQIKPDSFIWYGTNMYFTPVYIDSRNRVFIFPKSKNEVWLYHQAEKKFEVIADHLSTVATCISEDKHQNIWFSTNNELFKWNADRSWTDYTPVLDEALQFGKIQAIYEDQMNMIWIATDNGVIKFPNQQQLFQSWFNLPGDAWGNAMRGIFDDQSGRVYGYVEKGELGLHGIDVPGENSLYTYMTSTGRDVVNILDGAKHFIPDHGTNTVWTLTDKLIQINLGDHRIKQVFDLTGIADRFAHNPFLKLSNNSFLLGTTLKQLTLFNPETNTRTKFIKEVSPDFTSIQTSFFLDNKDGSVWIGTANDGLYLLSGDGQIMRHLTTTTQPAISNNHILVLFYDLDSNLWIGTFGGGLNRLNTSTYLNQIFTQKEGLANDNVTGILSDADKNIWISTYNGLSCYRTKENSFRNFFEDDGLSNNEFNYSSFFKDRNGLLWFGGMNGVQFFDPANVLQQSPNPPLVFTGFLRYNRLQDTLVTSILGDHAISSVVISPYDSYFQFTWTLPNYFKPDKNRYYVWLEGLEDNWTYIGNTPTVRYNKLPPGNYTLRIKGADSKGNWSETELTVPIYVKPFFYSTWWFILSCILLIGSLVYAFARYRLQRLLEMERMRTRIAGDLHDEVGSMLSGLAMQAEILELDPQKSDTVRLRRLSEISRMTLSKMRDVVWSIDSRRDQVKDLLDRMREHAEEMLTTKEMSFQFELGELPLEKKLQVDLRQHLFLFFKEAITNIVKHSNATMVTIRFGQFGNHFELSVHDNGTSISSTDSTGFGLQNLEMRAKKLGASFELKREHGFQVKLMRKSL